MDQKLTNDEVFDILEKRGIAYVDVEFSGGGDEGGEDSVTLCATDGSVTTLQKYDTFVYNAETKKSEYIKSATPEDDALYDAIVQPIYDKYFSFAGEFEVEGHLYWHVTETEGHVARSISMEGSEYCPEGFDDEVWESDLIREEE